MKISFRLGTRRSGALALSAVVLLVFPLLPPPHGSQEGSPAYRAYSLKQAQKVLRLIDKVEAESRQPWSGPLREIEVSEIELNAYIAYRIETEHEEIMKELRLKIFPENKVEGRIHIDLRGQKIPSFIRPEMDVYFAADLLVAGRSVKVDMKRLFVGDQPIQPYILDLVIAISAALDKTEATSINDWYELPYGIKGIKTLKGKAVFYY
jgi:hypothetical protein